MARRQPKQKSYLVRIFTNNTILGFIGGLIVGLIIAIVVAQSISSSPMLFNNRQGKLDRSPVSSANLYSDPNTPMYGDRNAAKEAYKKAIDEAEEIAEEEKNEVATAYLQAGAYKDQKEAENMRAKLALMGLEAQIIEVRSQNGNLYRVRLGPFTPTALANTQNHLKSNNIEYSTTK